MRSFLRAFFFTVLPFSFRSQLSLLAEIAVLREQLALLRNQLGCRRAVVSDSQKFFFVTLSRLWPGWRNSILIVKPATVIAWHKKGFGRFWYKKAESGKQGRGRRPISEEIKKLIRRMRVENTGWGVPRIKSELKYLGINVAQSTIWKYLPRNKGPGSQSWATFIRNHLNKAVAIDFLLTYTARFELFWVFVVLSLDRREILHINTTRRPTARWTGQQMVEALPYRTDPIEYVIRDRDSIYGFEFREKLNMLGLKEVITSYKSPWQNGYVERVIQSIRKECLDHIVPLSELHLKRVLKDYKAYYNTTRPHLSLDREPPAGREIHESGCGKIIKFPEVGGLHHRYERAAA